MVIFYAWTDTQLLNCVNVKSNFYDNEKAILIVWKLKRVSDFIIDTIREKNIFEKIIYLVPPHYYFERKRVGLIENLQSLVNGKRLRKDIETKLQCELGNCRVDKFITAAFWSESLMVYRYIKRYNFNIDIYFIEEGLACYNSPKGWLYKTSPSFSFKAKIREIMYYWNWTIKAQKSVKGIYLYAPYCNNGNLKMPLIKMPQITLKNSTTYKILEKVSDSRANEYSKRRIYYIADAPHSGELLYDNQFNKELSMILKCVPEENVCVKMHPLMETENLLKTRYKEVWFDDSGVTMPQRLLNLDVDKKIFICGMSSTVFELKNSFGKTPYIIFTYRLINTISKSSIERMDNFVKKFIMNYGNASKIAIPNTEQEFSDMLMNIILQCEEL